MSRFDIDDLINIIASHPDGLSLKALCDEYEHKHRTWIQPEHETQIKKCLKANDDTVYKDASGIWHIKQQQDSIQNPVTFDNRTEVKNRNDLFFKTTEGNAFLKLFDYIGTRYYIAPIGTIKRGTSYDQRDIPRENNICYDFFQDGKRVGVLYYKNGSSKTFTSFEVELKYIDTEEIRKNVDLSVFKTSDHTKNGRYKYQLIDFDKSAYSIEAICDEIDKHFASVKKRGSSGYKYVSFTTDRTWKNAIKYGFISAGFKSKNGKSYSSELFSLKLGDKVFVHIKAIGFVGYGIIESEATIAKDVVLTDLGNSITFADLSTADFDYLHHADDPEMAEYVVRIKWLHTVDEYNGIKERGMFTSQHIVCDPSHERWVETVSMLKKLWEVE